MSPHAGWDRESLWDLWSAALCEPHCHDPECQDCKPPTPQSRPGRHPGNNTAAIVIAVLMLIIAIGVILS